MKTYTYSEKPKRFETQLSNWYPQLHFLDSVIENFYLYSEQKHGCIVSQSRNGFVRHAVFTDAPKKTDKDYKEV